MSKPRLAVDWDGVCVKNVWPAQGDWLPGAVESLRTLLETCDIVIHTCRIARGPEPPRFPEKTQAEINGEFNYIRKMLDEADLQDVTIWTHPWKPGADVYLDDKAVRFTNWRIAMTKIGAILREPTLINDNLIGGR